MGRNGQTENASDASLVAVIDIGSNSVRLVGYDVSPSVPEIVFKENAMCHMGRDIATTKKLCPDGVKLAMEALKGFKKTLKKKEIATVLPLATAAVRDAEDGQDFVDRVHKDIGFKIKVISKKKEARYAALGAVTGDVANTGLIGDLGGGSLELIAVDNGEITAWESLKLGTLRLAAAEQETGSMDSLIAEKLDGISEFLEAQAGQPFVAVGGMWRQLGKHHMHHEGVKTALHGYTISGAEAAEFATEVADMSEKALTKRGPKTRRGTEGLPHAAGLLTQLFARLEPTSLTISETGMREGALTEYLAKKRDKRKPKPLQL